MDSNIIKFIQKNSPDGGFLQSEEWRKFQKAVGHRTFNISGENFYANIIEHKLPVVGKYFYIPRGPIFNQFSNSNDQINKDILEQINLAEKENAGWIRIEPRDEKILAGILKTLGVQEGHQVSKKYKIVKAPHDMQPREIFIIDVTKPEDQLLAEMKSKTRYNIKLSQKHGVVVKKITSDGHSERSEESRSNKSQDLTLSAVKLNSGSFAYAQDDSVKKYIEEFLRLVKITANRDGITPHPEKYYRKMFETIPAENLKLYVAEYNNKIIAANIIIYYGNTATYLHGASDNEYRNVMAPYLLQWQQILDAKKEGLARYDFGGVKICHSERSEESRSNKSQDLTLSAVKLNSGSFAYAQDDNVKNWTGITKFKLGFSPNTQPVEFPGSYDTVINPFKYYLYRALQKVKNVI